MSYSKNSIRRSLAIVLVIGAALGSSVAVWSAAQGRQPSSRQDHVAWVGEVFTRMQTVKPGMTRSDLLKVFTTEGGLSTGLHRTFVSRDCPYFKVDVEFKAVGRPSRDANGQGTQVEGSQDIIVKISRPYLQSRVID
jgi:hypothetical protein